MRQPGVYNKEEELIKWLEYDLEKQRIDISKNRNISPDDVKCEELFLHIGNKNFKSIEKIKINFEFDFSAIIKKINIKNNEIYYKVNCASLIFNRMVDFSDKKHNNKIVFYNELKFNNSNFNEIAYFVNISFEKKVDFSNTLFNGQTCFRNILFNCIVDFQLIYISKIKFSNITIKENFNLSIMNINEKESYKEAIFNKVEFENDKSILNIFHVDIKINKFSLNNTIINGIVNIKNMEVETVDFKGSIINGGVVNPVKFKVHNFANRESALFLKNEAYARNNIIDALEYKAKEIELHKKELLKNKKDYKKWGDIFSIYLSSFYSNNGLNWVKSLRRTILITIIFFSIFYLPDILHLNYIINKLYYKDYLYRFAEYFIPTNYDHLIEYLKNSNVCVFIKICGIIVYFSGKIAFWYGSVQTVQAFRKFSKKE